MTADPLRVLFVTHNYPRHASDVAGSFLHLLAIALRDEGVDVSVLAPSGEGLPDRGELDGVPIHRFRYAPRAWESLAHTGTMAEQVQGSWRGKAALAGLLAGGSVALRGAIARTVPQLVHAHWWFPGGILALGGAGDLPVVTTLHGSDVRLARRVTLAHPVFRRVIDRSARVTAVSSFLAGEARAMAPEARVDVAPMPTDLTRFRRRVNTPDPGLVLFVGRLNEQKGLADLLEALAWVPDATLEVVGEGDDADALRARADGLEIGSRVRWRGRVARAELPEAYARATVVVIPSREEGLGLVAVEAQLCGTPVVAYRSGGLIDVVDPAWGGRLVAPGDVRALADAIADALGASRPHNAAAGDASEAARVIDRARAEMERRFAPRAVAATYRRLYDEARRSGR